MQFYYGSQMPLRVLDEAEFWKKQESEHTVLARKLVNNLEQEYVDGLRRWKDVLDTTHEHAKRYIESAVRSDNQLAPHLYDQLLDLVSFCAQESVAFIQYCKEIRDQSKAIVDNHTAKVVIAYIIKESEGFTSSAQNILYEKT